MRVAPFGHPRINGYVRLPAAFRSLSRPSSAPSAKAFTLRSFSLDLAASMLAYIDTSHFIAFLDLSKHFSYRLRFLSRARCAGNLFPRCVRDPSESFDASILVSIFCLRIPQPLSKGLRLLRKIISMLRICGFQGTSRLLRRFLAACPQLQEFLSGSSCMKFCLRQNGCFSMLAAELLAEKNKPGGHLLSRTVSSAVPSADRVLTVVFGMGTGVSPGRIAARFSQSSMTEQ